MAQDDIREIRIDPIVPAESVLISTARGKRPRQHNDPPARDARELVDSCPFCPGNEHLTPPSILQVPETGKWDIRIVENLFPVLDDDFVQPGIRNGIQQAIEGYGHHEVIIDHHNHGITLRQFSRQHLALLLAVYRDRMKMLYRSDSRIRYILVFKNFGREAGASMPHSHSQLIAMPVVPHNLQDEIQHSHTFHKKHGECVFCALVDTALSLKTTAYETSSGKTQHAYETGKYVIERGKHFVAIKPYASRYEWEVHILPLEHQSDFLQTSEKELDDLAGVLKRTMARLEKVIGDLQYNYFLHTLPHGEFSNFEHRVHWHIEICPRTSIPSGFELGSGLFINTVSPEKAADLLRKAEIED